MGIKTKGRDRWGSLNRGSSSEDVAFVLVEKKKLDGPQKKGKAVKK